MSKYIQNHPLAGEYIAQRKAAGESDWWCNYHLEHAAEFVRLSSGTIITIEKPHIETSFCFGESGYDYEDALASARAAKENADFFRTENMKDIQRWIDALTGGGCVWIHENRGRTEIYCTTTGFRPAYLGMEGYYEATEADRAALLDGYRKVYAGFEKRLNAYLKRYGLSKVHSWTYWRDA